MGAEQPVLEDDRHGEATGRQEQPVGRPQQRHQDGDQDAAAHSREPVPRSHQAEVK